MEKGDSLNKKIMFTNAKGELTLQVGDFFQTLTYILMVTAFITLVLIFLQLLRGREDTPE